MKNMESVIQQNVAKWLEGNIDESAKETIRLLQATDQAALADAFYRNLEFGTGGLRGIMGIGTNRINKYTIGMATQGFANYLKGCFPNTAIKIAIAHDSRNNSRTFAEITANVMAANGIKVFLFESLRPTPELSFTIRQLNCQAGVVCTASHNPKEYNGYKAYWNDGGQLVPPHDENVIKEVEKINSVDEVQWSGGEANIVSIGKEMDEAYFDMVKGLSVYPDVISRQHDLKIVYTPIHGSGIKLVPEILKRFGFTNVTLVDEQIVPDGNFPTVVYPNPEESEAMAFGLAKAKAIGADILLGTDPDADRVGIGVKDHEGNWVLLNGNQTAVLAFNYMIEARNAKGISKPNDMIIKTIVTTDMIDVFAAKNNIKCYNVLTGFKWIAELIKEKEATENYVIGGEESYGLMIGDKLRDKDAVSAVALLCEMAAYEKDRGKSLFDKLIELYLEYGFYKEHLISITKKGMDGQQQIAAMMETFRNNPPAQLAGISVVTMLDYEMQSSKIIQTGETTKINLPKSNVLQFVLEDGSKISARPSGTEPKIKFYFSVNTVLPNKESFNQINEQLNQKIKQIILDLGV
jgi:phosphoglucomutase